MGIIISALDTVHACTCALLVDKIKLRMCEAYILDVKDAWNMQGIEDRSVTRTIDPKPRIKLKEASACILIEYVFIVWRGR